MVECGCARRARLCDAHHGSVAATRARPALRQTYHTFRPRFNLLPLFLIPTRLLTFICFLYRITGNPYAFKDIPIAWGHKPGFFLLPLLNYLGDPLLLAGTWDFRSVNILAVTTVLMCGLVLLKWRRWSLAFLHAGDDVHLALIQSSAIPGTLRDGRLYGLYRPGRSRAESARGHCDSHHLAHPARLIKYHVLPASRYCAFLNHDLYPVCVLRSLVITETGFVINRTPKRLKATGCDRLGVRLTMLKLYFYRHRRITYHRRVKLVG